MPQLQAVNALRSETEDLRNRSERLRQSSRELQRRSEECRRRVASTISALNADASEPAVGSNPYVEKLLRAEADLEGAIEECRVALEEVRRELRWRDDSGGVVH